jgi:hypothetical protein
MMERKRMMWLMNRLVRFPHICNNRRRLTCVLVSPINYLGTRKMYPQWDCEVPVLTDSMPTSMTGKLPFRQAFSSRP